LNRLRLKREKQFLSSFLRMATHPLESRLGPVYASKRQCEFEQQITPQNGKNVPDFFGGVWSQETSSCVPTGIAIGQLTNNALAQYWWTPVLG
jgi:hypothetical protein